MGSKSDVVVKLILVFFISLLSFSIGTYVGKKYSDNQHKLSSLEPKKVTKDERAVASVDEKEKKHETLTDDEIKKLAEEFVADDDTEASPSESHETAASEHKAPSHETAHAATATPAPTPHVTPHEKKAHQPPKVSHENKTSHEATAAAHQMIEGKNPKVPAKPQPRHPTSLPKDVAQYAVGKFTVQVASFGTEDEAKKRANELKENGYSAFYVPAQVKGKSWYRVSVGLFATENEAKDYKKEFSSKSKIESAIIQKIAN
ncbi:MAG: SPOR domain-containing protein [Bdellovibrionota bacterium]